MPGTCGASERAHNSPGAEYEAGTWEGHLERIHVGRATEGDDPLVTVAVKFPASMVAAIDAKSDNRSDYIRKAVASTL